MFLLILLLAFSFRYFGINWDQGHHLHPDERMIIMVVDRIHLPKTSAEWQALTTPKSPLNPKFFAYGSFPIYLLKFTSWLFKSDNYQGMLYIGRYLSILFELGTVVLVFLIAKALKPPRTVSRLNRDSSEVKKSRKTAVSGFGFRIFPFLAMFFYSISVLPIQSSHFFISDIPLTFLTTLTLYLSLRLILNSQLSTFNSLLLGVSLGLALATKVTAILLIIPIISALVLLYLRHKKLKYLIFSATLITIGTVIAFAVAMPYGIIDFPNFKAHTLEQSRMRTDPFVFPFTLQYVNTTPYWYFVKNLVLWGMGLPLGLLTVTGTIYTLALWLYQMSRRFIKSCIEIINSDGNIDVILNLFQNPFRVNLRDEPTGSRIKSGMTESNSISILLIFFITYFVFMGNSAVKFMRYMLPIYPLLCVFGSLFLFHLINKLKALKPENRINAGRVTILLALFLCALWPLSLLSIYAKPHTRIAASEWIFDNISTGAKLGIEHWDDSLPLVLPGETMRFQFVDFPLYEGDTPQKWKMMEDKLQAVDYIIIASNRLYVPLMRLTDCGKLPQGRCYPKTAEYYKNLFSGNLGFTKVAEFTSYPQLSINNYQLAINDDSADESFTVYDHPKIMIFKKAY